MMRLHTARLAMVALTAMAMAWTTTAHASDFDTEMVSAHSTTVSAYSNQPQDPSQLPNPGSPGPVSLLPADMKVSYLGQTVQNGAYSWKYEIKNIGQGTAHKVSLSKSIQRQVPASSEDSSEWWGDVAPGASKTITLTCQPKSGLGSCYMSSVTAFLNNGYAGDSNKDNNWAASWFGA